MNMLLVYSALSLLTAAIPPPDDRCHRHAHLAPHTGTTQAELDLMLHPHVTAARDAMEDCGAPPRGPAAHDYYHVGFAKDLARAQNRRSFHFRGTPGNYGEASLQPDNINVILNAHFEHPERMCEGGEIERMVANSVGRIMAGAGMSNLNAYCQE